MDDISWMQMTADFAVAAGVSALAYGSAGFVSAAAYTAWAAPIVTAGLLSAGSIAAAPVVGIVVVGAGTAVGGHFAYEWAAGEIKEHLYERPMDRRAELAGRVVGSVAGSVVGIQAGYDLAFAWRYPDFKTYSREARALTRQVYARHRPTIDPGRLRGKLHHLDHVTSVRAGYELRLPVSHVAAPGNLRILPWGENLKDGARLGVPPVPPVACPVVRIAC